ncbi:MAG TPA: glycosyltransferase family 39 protein [Candidatus Binatia bacterium]|nr:glycosyltransferase family 39 protein [Candidatus Binatia bacterium]
MPRIALASRVGWYAVGLGCSLVLALALRLVGLTWGFPHEFHIDEDLVINLTQRLMMQFKETGSLNPDSSSYGALPLYLLAVASAAAAQVISVTQTILPIPIHSAPPLYVARLLSAIESLATVWLTAELARRLFGRSVALLTALFLGICLLPVREAHFGTVDTLLGALISLTLLLGEQITRRGLWKDYVKVSVALALAAATKIVALLVLAPIALAHAWKQIHRPESSAARAGWSRRLLPLIATVTLVAALWLALNPYVLLDPDIYFNLDRNDSLRTQNLVVRGKLPVLYTLQFLNETPYLYIVTNLLRWGMGLPLEMLALAGVGYSLWHLLGSLRFFGIARSKAEHSAETTAFADVYLLSWLLIYFFFMGSWYAQFVRYALPLIPVLCLLASRLVVDLWQRGGRVARGLSGGLTAGVFTASLAYTLAYSGIYREPDVRLATVAWLRGNVPAGSSMLVEKDEAIFLHRSEYRKAYGLTDYRWQIWNPYEVDGVKSIRYQAPAVSDARTRAHLASLLITDYIVISRMWCERFMSAAAQFPAQADFYRRLFSEQAGYHLVRTFSADPKLGPFIWRDEPSEITFRMFDHPTIYIFARDSERQL